MKNNRIASLGAVVIASLTLAGCGSDRELAYRDTQIQELERVNKELEMQLVACSERHNIEIIKANPGITGEDLGKQTINGGHVFNRPMELVISIENSVLFKPGSAELSTAAKNTLAQVIALIHTKYNDGYWVRVDGHTDDEKIVKSKDQWDDNWDLSGGRSQKVLHYLLEHGIPAAKLGFAGFADQRPLEPNSSAANRSKNRRVEIVVIPKNPGK
jgi:flagellar motor protein MotB